jgi:hypothetical protein
MQAQHLRHQYLAVLGVSSWLSRTQLPGAAASPDWVSSYVYSEEALSQGLNAEGDEPVSNDGSKAQVKSLAASLVTGNADVEEISRDAQLIAQDVVTHLPVTQRENRPIAPPILAPLVEPKLKQTEAAVVATHVMPNARSQKSAPQMRLMFWQYPDVLVVDSLPTQTRGTLASAQYEKLLNNMILAMRLNPARIDAGAQPYALNWPTLAGASIDQGWDQAVSAVQYKLSKLLQGYSPKLVLMLGESAAQMLMNVEDDFDAMRGIVFSLRADTKAITSYSLTQMLNVPGCKRDVWQDLQKVLDK